ncbi:MAG: hypothetical protein ACLUYV_08675 [Alistipes shahii]
MPGHATAALAAYPELACGHGRKVSRRADAGASSTMFSARAKSRPSNFSKACWTKCWNSSRRSSSTSAATSVPAYVGRSAPTAGPAWRTKGSRTKKPDCKPT